jgi:hypothetical protein
MQTGKSCEQERHWLPWWTSELVRQQGNDILIFSCGRTRWVRIGCIRSTIYKDAGLAVISFSEPTQTVFSWLAAPVFQMLFWDRPQQHTHPVVNAFLNELHKHVSSNLRISPCIPCFGSASTSLPTDSRLLSLLLSHPSPAFRILLEGCCGQSEYRVQRKHQL